MSLVEITLLSVNDPALDKEASDLEAYEETGDASYLVARQGCRLMEFVCTPLTVRERMRLDDETKRYVENVHQMPFIERCLDIFINHVTKIANFSGWDVVEAMNEGKILESWLDRSGIPVSVIFDIGRQLRTLAALNEEQRKN